MPRPAQRSLGRQRGISASRGMSQSSMNLIVKTALQPNFGHPTGSPVIGL